MFDKEKVLHEGPHSGRWRRQLYEIIFEDETTTGRVFDLILIFIIGLSVLAVMLESVEAIQAQHGTTLRAAEWVFTILFTIEYFFRLVCVPNPKRYALSFFGIVDLLAIIPTYLSLLVPGTQFLVVIRLLRVLRVFRVLKLVQYLKEANELLFALQTSRRKIQVFFFFVVTLVMILGSLMYFIEGDESGFTSIPRSIYWAIVTLTTVGYGDISPQTDLGQTLAAIVMLLGYAIIAVPTGIVTAELVGANRAVRPCPSCNHTDHEFDAVYCKRCGEAL